VQSWELRSRRIELGLTLRQVARAAGTSETNVAAYERGAKTAHPRTLRRLLTAIEAGSDSAVHRHNLLTVPATAAALRKGLRAQWSTADLLRLVREMRSNAVQVTNAADRAAFFAEPSTTGDPRWDAMLAGSVEDLALRGEFPVPPWTRGHALPQFWFVGSAPSLQAYAFARSPFSLQVRGVMVDPADLESV
jgi:transcriptional regulator with XRE-family HTH domain